MRKPLALLTIDDAMYGLRNLSVGDEEETRIQDQPDLPADIRALVDAGDYIGAYRLAIAQTLIDTTPADVWTRVQTWVNAFNSDQGYDPDTDDALTPAELWTVYQGDILPVLQTIARPMPAGTLGAYLDTTYPRQTWHTAIDEELSRLPADCPVALDCLNLIAQAERTIALLSDALPPHTDRNLRAAVIDQCKVFYYG